MLATGHYTVDDRNPALALQRAVGWKRPSFGSRNSGESGSSDDPSFGIHPDSIFKG